MRRFGIANLIIVLAAGLAAAVLLAPRATREPAGPPAVTTASQPATDDLIAERRYENLLNGQRAGTIVVVWRWTEHDGQRLVEDTTRFRTRTARDMAGTHDIFESDTVATTLRTEAGHLVSMETTTRLASRVDRVRVRRTTEGYAFESEVGDNPEAYEFATPGPAYVDAECFLGPRIRAGEAPAGSQFTYPLLDARGRRLIDSRLTVAGEDEEGPGLKVVESVQGSDVLWWFAPDGSVVRQRNGDTVLRRRDDISPDDLGGAPAVYSITLETDIDLPRIFTARSLEVDLEVVSDETVHAPRVPENPFTETLQWEEGRVRLLLHSHDDPTATTTLPISREGFEEDCRATPLMESDDPEVKALARRLVGRESDARRAAALLANYVFTTLRKGSSDIGEPTAKQILRDRGGDCSEHALLFTALCRAAGIPARRCFGYVDIGSDWGAHAWCEIWVGKWIGADPTTNEIGTRARYIFCGRQDDPTLEPATIRAERTQIRIRKAEFDDGTLDFTDPSAAPDPILLTGIRFAPLPEGWKTEYAGRRTTLRCPEGEAVAMIEPDHGYRAGNTLPLRGYAGFEPAPFGGHPAFVQRMGRATWWIVPLGRELLHVQWTSRRGSAPAPPENLPALFVPILTR